ncbi:Murein hydrolase activator EnvC [hydrothermal vent metagenome]|uniref:Murein hydrolase activator EnvC n=1 Tax=hydrothermal vent metagenome TaxID=652676 RepID=A0A3B1B2E7_9ZZZZ
MLSLSNACRSLSWGVWILLLALANIQAAPSASTSLDTGEEELKQIRGRINALQNELKSAKDQQTDLNNKLQVIERNIGLLARRMRVLGGTLERQQGRLTQLHKKRLQQQQELEVHSSALSRQIRASYAMGRQDRIKILLNQQNPATVSRVMTYYDYFNRARAEQLTLLKQLMVEIQETEAEATQETARLKKLQSHELQQQDLLKQARQTRYKVIKSLAAEISLKGAELGGLKKDEQQLQSLMQRLQQELVSVPTENVVAKPFKALKGRLPWPSKGLLTTRFGTPKGAGLTWDGVVIAGQEGQEVKAVHHGRVAFADWLRGFGLLLIIDHGDGYMTLYGHNQSLFKETGDWVAPGDIVALVGSSGGRPKAGVYFSIRKQGKPVNPKFWCKKPNGNRVS